MQANPGTPTEGAVVAEVASGSPAEQAGIQKGDIVVAVDGRSIRGASQLRNSVGLTPVGHRIELTIARNGTESKVSVEVAPANNNSAVLDGCWEALVTIPQGPFVPHHNDGATIDSR
jgi:S1-C subfamily serine protease